MKGDKSSLLNCSGPLERRDGTSAIWKNLSSLESPQLVLHMDPYRGIEELFFTVTLKLILTFILITSFRGKLYFVEHVEKTELSTETVEMFPLSRSPSKQQQQRSILDTNCEGTKIFKKKMTAHRSKGKLLLYT